MSACGEAGAGDENRPRRRLAPAAAPAAAAEVPLTGRLRRLVFSPQAGEAAAGGLGCLIAFARKEQANAAR